MKTATGQRATTIYRLKKYLARPRTMDQLTERFDVQRRAIFRYFDSIQDEGIAVSRVGVGRPTRYKIA